SIVSGKVFPFSEDYFSDVSTTVTGLEISSAIPDNNPFVFDSLDIKLGYKNKRLSVSVPDKFVNMIESVSIYSRLLDILGNMVKVGDSNSWEYEDDIQIKENEIFSLNIEIKNKSGQRRDLSRTVFVSPDNDSSAEK
ncbi:MAG: hypothetical protein PF588_05705, partial [Candidatus Kapabacteria bacterium]|nr:hypothetical protein [Candidatus Kapabacteria bacterium]